MGRPKVPLLDRESVVRKALELIDRDGVDEFNIRGLAAELGVNGGALYHHFTNKAEILEGVRLLIMNEARVHPPRSPSVSWRDYVTKSARRYRRAMLSHPNAASILTAVDMRAVDYAPFEYVLLKMAEDGVPIELRFAILDSVQTLAFGSVHMNPRALRPRERHPVTSGVVPPEMSRAVQDGPDTAEALFRLELDALLAGWSQQVEAASARPRTRLG